MSGTESCADRLGAIVDAVLPALRGVDDARAARSPGAGVWSPKQVLGHLVDSAANNHPRFVRAQSSDDLVFPGYDQEAWVRLQAYEDAPWHPLLELWAAYNRHLAWLIARIPEATRLRARARHNLHEIAWRHVPAETPATLEYLIADYVGHCEHHLRQVHERLGLANPARIGGAETPR